MQGETNQIHCRKAAFLTLGFPAPLNPISGSIQTLHSKSMGNPIDVPQGIRPACHWCINFPLTARRGSPQPCILFMITSHSSHGLLHSTWTPPQPHQPGVPLNLGDREWRNGGHSLVPTKVSKITENEWDAQREVVLPALPLVWILYYMWPWAVRRTFALLT